MTMTNYLRTLKDEDIFPDKNFEDGVFTKRVTVKAVALNNDSNIAIVTNPIHNFFLLPGGGVDDGESLEEAIVRECDEEINAQVEIIKEIGVTHELRGRDHKEYDSHGFVVRVVGESTNDTRTQGEREVGLNIKWLSVEDLMKKFDEQERLLHEGKVDFYNTGFNIVRDKIFLEKAIELNLIPDIG